MLDPVIEVLRDRCPSFERRFGGAADYAAARAAGKLIAPAGYVLPLDDQVLGPANKQQYKQPVRDGFAVAVVLPNFADERGQAAANYVMRIRYELWRALLGWEPDEEHGPIEYDGGSLIELTRAQLWYQYEFFSETEVDVSLTWQGDHLESLPPITSVLIDIDAIDPFDRNLAPSGPDGHVELRAGAILNQE